MSSIITLLIFLLAYSYLKKLKKIFRYSFKCQFPLKSKICIKYRLGIIGSGTLHRDLQSFWAKINNKPDPNSIINATNNSSNKGRRFLALKGINLEAEKGVVVGLIG